jgi:glycosyltransferase involved in cell wall biosynthesis
MVRAELGISDQMFVFAHASRCDPQKDHVSLAKAFSRVHAACNDARLIVCGDGLASGNPYFEGLPFSATARAAVIALGPRDDLSRLWQAADAFVLSSVGEGFPNVLVEAMACGLPCVTTDVGDAAEIVSHTGKVVPPQDSEALVRAMQAILEMPYEERVRLGAAARARVQERFTVERMAAGFRRVWSEVITEDAS